MTMRRAVEPLKHVCCSPSSMHTVKDALALAGPCLNAASNGDRYA
jgi:hypothetical protein